MLVAGMRPTSQNAAPGRDWFRWYDVRGPILSLPNPEERLNIAGVSEGQHESHHQRLHAIWQAMKKVGAYVA